MERGRTLMLRGELDGAVALYTHAATRFPDSTDACLGLAGLHWQRRHLQQAEAVLHQWLASHPDNEPAAFLLAQLLREQGRLQAAADVLHQLFAHGAHDEEAVIRAVEMLDDYGRPRDAARICEAAIDAGSVDARLHAYAGMLAIQLGEFARVRERYSFALARDPDAVNWNIPLGLAGLQRYDNAQHPDLAFFREVLQRPALDQRTRIHTLFALGKAFDDLGEFKLAVDTLREANAAAHAQSHWPRKLWKRGVDARMAAPRNTLTLAAPSDWTPVFIVGVPRSGTTLLAELLARHRAVCNRGELGWLDVIAQRLSAAPSQHRQAMEDAAALYAAQLRQDDSDARWFIDKQPLNLLHVDLIMALWPNARILLCVRNPRDTALSLWSQSFHDTAHDYAYDFGDIATVIQGCARLKSHWLARYPDSVRLVRYEELASAPAATVSTLLPWLGIAPQAQTSPSPDTTISTASAWQARQPVYTRSIERWRHYAPYLPELLKLPQA